MPSPTRSRLLWLLPFIAGVAALAWWRPWSAPRVAPLTEATVAEAPAGPPLFARWMRFEPQAVRAHAEAGDSYFDAMLGHQIFRSPPRGVPPAGRPPAPARRRQAAALVRAAGCGRASSPISPASPASSATGTRRTACGACSTSSFAVDGQPVVIYDNQYWIERYPSHTAIHYELPRRVARRAQVHHLGRSRRRHLRRHESTTSSRTPSTIEAVAVPAGVPNSRETPPAYPLLARRQLPGHAALHLPRRAGLHAARRRRSSICGATSPSRPSGATPRDRRWRSASTTPNRRRRQRRCPTPRSTQAHEYNRWFADNVPYFDAPDPGFKKMWYYRWWIVRFQLVDMATRPT